VQLINLPQDYVYHFQVFAGGTTAAFNDSRYASVCPSVKDGYILYDGDDPSTSVVLSGEDTLTGRVNEYMSIRIGTAFGGGNSYEYSLVSDSGENLDTLPADMGISLSSDGVLEGYPKRAGTYEFVVRVKSTSNSSLNYVTYDSKSYTLVVDRAEYPTLAISTDLEQITYATESIELEYSNFPVPVIEGLLQEDTAVSDAVLEYEIIDNPGVVEIVTDSGTGKTRLNILATGTTVIRVTKPVDGSYNSTSLEFTLTVQKADLWLSVDGAELYYGALQLPPSLGDLYIEGLRGHSDENGASVPVLVDAAMISELAALGIAEPTVQIPTELQSQYALETAELGTYRLIINSITPVIGSEAQYEDTLSKYNVRYRHGLVQIIRKLVQASDYDVFAIEADGSVNYSSPIANKANGRWYNHGIVVRPSASSGYSQISGDGGVTWTDELRFTAESNKVISMHLRNNNVGSGNYGITTDDYDFYVRIDKTNPAAEINYSTTHSEEPLFHTELDKTVYGGVYRNPFTISMEGGDPQSNYVASGIRQLEYLVLTGDETLENHTSLWLTASSSEEISVNTSAAAGYYLRAIDYAGNVSPIVRFNYTDEAARSGWFVMDNSAPAINFSNAASFANWRKYENGIPDLIFTAQDDMSGVSSLTYSVDSGTTNSIAISPDGSYTLSLNDKITTDGTHTVLISAVDKVGNSVQQTLSVKKDSVDPQITITPEWEVPAKYTQSKIFKVSVTGVNPSGIKSVTVSLGNTVYDITGSLVDGVYSYTALFQGDAVTYTVTATKNARMADGATYVSKSEDIIVPKVDSTVPILTVTGKVGQLVYSEAGLWTSSDVVLTYTNNSATKGKTRLYAYVEGHPETPLFYNDLLGETEGANPLWIIDGLGSALTNTYKTTQSNPYCFRLVSESGVEGNTVNFRVSVDKTKPVITNPYVRSGSITIFLNALTGGLFFKEAEVVVPVTDAGSGIANVRMTLTPTSGNGNPVVATKTFANPESATATFAVGINFRGFISLSATDFVGNASDTFTTQQDIIVDNLAPVYNDVALSPVELPGIWTASQMNATINGIADTGYFSSGLDRLDYWKSDSQWDAQTSQIPSQGVVSVPAGSFTDNSYSFLIDFPDDGTEGTPDGSYYLITAIYDRAGNRDIKSTLVHKDSVTPKIKAEGGVSLGGKLMKDEDGNYVFKPGEYAKPGDQIKINLETRVSPQKIIVLHKDSAGVETSYGTNGEMTVSPSGDMYGYFTLPSVDDPNGTYTFLVYGGNGNYALPDEDTAAGLSVKLTTTNEIDPHPPQVPVIAQSSLDYYGDGLGEDYHAVWLRDMADIDVSYTETEGATEWLEFAVKDEITETFADTDFVKINGTDGSGNSGNIISRAGAASADEFDEDGVYTVAFRTADASGRVSDYVLMRVLRDAIAPTLGAARLLNAPSGTALAPYSPKNTALYAGIDALFGQAVYVGTSANDASANVSYGEYTGDISLQYAVTSGDSPDAGTLWYDYGTPVDVLGEASEFTGSIWFRATDEAGNTTPAAAYRSSGKLVVNTNAPDGVLAAGTRLGEDPVPTDQWSVDDVIFTVSGGTMPQTTLDQYQYAYKVDGGIYGGWTDFPNGDTSAVEDTLALDSDFAVPVNGEITVKFRAVSHTGVAGPEFTHDMVYKDDVAPDIQVTITGKTGTSSIPNWTNSPVSFALSNRSGNTAPVTYSVKISGVNGGNPIDLTSDGQEILINSVGMISQGRAVWNSTTKTLVFSGDILDNNAVSFAVSTSAGLSDTSSDYYVSIQESTDHLVNDYLIGLADLSVSEQPLGLLNSTETPAWCNQWYNNENTGYPTVRLTTPAEFHHANGAPVSVYYTLKNTSTNTTRSGNISVSASVTSDDLFTPSADGKYTFEIWTADAAGNASVKTNGTLYIDRTAPTGVNIGRGASNWLDVLGSSLNFKWFSNDYATQVSVSSNTNVAGILSYGYIIEKTTELTDAALAGITAPAEDDPNWQPMSATTPRITLPNGADDFLGMIFVRIEDKAGNVSLAQTDGVAVEDGVPLVDYTLSTSLPQGYGWFDQNPVLSISATDNETVATGISSVTVYEKQNGSVVKQTAVYQNTTNELKESFTYNYTTTTQGEFETYVVVRDRAGNETTSPSHTLKVDAGDPQLTVNMSTAQGAYLNDTWTNRNVTVTLSATGYTSGIAYSYSEDGGSTWYPLAENTLYIRDDYNESLRFKAESLSGRKDTEDRIIKVQKNMPGALSGFLNDTGGTIFSLTATGTANSLGWRNAAFDLVITAPYRTLRVKGDGQTREQAPVITYYTLEKKNSQGAYVAIPAKSGSILGGVAQSPVTINITDDGYYRCTVYAKDMATNETNRYIVEYQLDTTAPTAGAVYAESVNITGILNLLTFNLFYKKDIRLNVTADYNISGKQRVEYMRVRVDTAQQLNTLKAQTSIAEGAGYLNGATWQTVTTNDAVFYDTEEFIGLYFIRLTDRAGNQTVFNSNGVVIDLVNPSAPVVTLTGSRTTTDKTQTGQYEALQAGFWYQSVKVDYTTRDSLSGINRIEIYHHYADSRPSELKQTLTHAQLLEIQNELGFYNREYHGSYLATEIGAYRVEVRVYDEAGGYSTQFTDNLYIDNAQPVLTVAKRLSDSSTWPLAAQGWTGWVNQTLTFTLSCKDTEGNYIYAPVTYWYKVDGGDWNRIEETTPGSGIYRVTAASEANDNINASYYFRALVGTVNTSGEYPIWTVYENGKLAGSDGVPPDPAALENEVKIQKTPPDAFEDADFSLYQYVSGPVAEGVQLTDADEDINAQDGWFNQHLTVAVALPRPMSSAHAPMTTAYELKLDGVTVADQSGISDIGDGHLFFQLDEDGTYTITVLTTDYATNTNTTFTKTVKVDASMPELEKIQVGTFENAAASILESLTYGLFFKHVTVDIGVNFEVSGRHTINGLYYQLAPGVNAQNSIPQPTEGGWVALTGSDTAFTFQNDFHGIIYVKAMDKAGNQSANWLSNGLISDNTVPVLTVSAQASGAVNEGTGWTADSNTAVTTDWLNRDVTLTIDATDITDGLNTLSTVDYVLERRDVPAQNSSGTLYSENQTIDPANPPAGMAPQTLTLTADDVYTLIVTAKDRSGNQSVRTMIIKVDQNAPVADDIVIMLNGTDVCALGEAPQNIYITGYTGSSIQAEGASTISGVQKREYQIVELGSSLGPTWATYSDDATFSTVLSVWNNKTYNIHVRVTDNAGNVTTAQSQTIFMDTVAPTVNISGNPTEWIDTDVTLTVSANDYAVQGDSASGLGSGLQAEAYRYTFNGSAGDWTDQNSQTYQANGTVKVEVRDNAGNIKEQTVVINRIDKLLPNNGSIQNVLAYTASNWYHASQTITAVFNATEGTAGYPGSKEWLQYKVTDADNSANNTDWTGIYPATGSSVTIDTATFDQGTTIVAYRVIDEMGRIYELPTEAIVNLDTTAPAEENISVYGRKDSQPTGVNLRALLEGMTLGWFFNENLELTIQSDASVSGEAQTRYYLSNHETAQAISVSDTIWNTAPVYDNSNKPVLPVVDPHRGVIYVRVADNAGNMTVIATELIVVDAEAPIAPTVTAQTEINEAAYIQHDAPANWVNENVAFTVGIPTGQQPTALIERYEYATKALGETNWSEWATAENGHVTMNVNDGTIQTTAYKFRAISYSGIVGEETVFGNVYIDKATPAQAQVTIQNAALQEETPDPNTWYKDNELTVTVPQDAGSPVAAWYKTSAEGQWQSLTLTDNTAIITLSLGVNDIYVLTKDGAENYDISGEEGRLYVVLHDNGLPELTVTPQVNGTTAYTDGGYTNKTVTFEIESRSVSPFYKIEVWDGTNTVTLTEGTSGLTLTRPAVLGGVYTAAYTYTLPASAAADTDGINYTVTAYT
ncbi:MAG: hypothetical protein EOM54_12555, partial [Clostridia bacterium]|nr:hypothetical protein [Clostridia bacterium]